MKIYYLSATGNSLVTARRLARELDEDVTLESFRSIRLLPEIETGDTAVGFVSFSYTHLVYLGGLSIQWLDTRLLFKSVNPATVHLLGTGFKKNDSVTVQMMMNNNGTHGLTYDVKAEFKDENTFNLTIPPSVACGVYDVKVKIRGRTAYLDRELTVQVQGTEQTTAFGPYVFTSYQKQTVGDSTLLSGYVTLNNWLCFKGDLVLRGSRDNTQIQMEDSTGAYIRYYAGRSKGLAELLRSKNMVLPLPSLGTLKLYNDIQHNA